MCVGRSVDGAGRGVVGQGGGRLDAAEGLGELDALGVGDAEAPDYEDQGEEVGGVVGGVLEAVARLRRAVLHERRGAGQRPGEGGHV